MQGMQEAMLKVGLVASDFPAAQEQDIEVEAEESIPEHVTHDNALAAPTSHTPKQRREPNDRGDRRNTGNHKGNFKSKPRAPLIISMATVEHGNREGEIVFRGCLVPGTNIDGDARARVVAPNRDCPAWFMAECRKIADDFSDKQVRIRVTHTIANGIAFANPAADSLEQLDEEWDRQKRDIENYPQSLDACPGLATGVKLIFREAVRVFSNKNDQLELLKLVTRSPADGGSYAVLGIKRNGMIFKFTGAEEVWAERDQILAGELDLAKAIKTKMKGVKISNISDLD